MDSYCSIDGVLSIVHHAKQMTPYPRTSSALKLANRDHFYTDRLKFLNARDLLKQVSLVLFKLSK